MSTLEEPATAATIGRDGTPAGDPTDPAMVERTVKASEGWIAIDWKEIFQARDLFITLVMRDIKIRYKQTVLGLAWAVLQPLAGMIVLTLIFSNFQGVKPPDVPYPLFLLAGLIPWNFFSSAVSSAGTSLLAQQHLITKIYFPRLFVPASTVGTFLVDMAVGLGLFAVLMPLYGFSPSFNLIFLPMVILLAFTSAFGLGLVFASVTVLFRDLRFVIPFLMSLLMYASPVFYQPSILSSRIQLLVAANPVTGIVTAFRWCILGLPLDVQAVTISTIVSIVVLVFGLYSFRRTERFLADLI